MHVLTTSILCIVHVLFYQGSYSNSNSGKHFVISYFSTINLDEEEAYFLVSTDIDTVHTDMSLRMSSLFIMKTRRIVTKGKVQKISLKDDFRQSGVLMNPLVEVFSSYPISITAFIINKFTRASYLALPVNVYDTEYRVVTFGGTGRCACSITSISSHTHVTLILKQEVEDFLLNVGDELVPLNNRKKVHSMDTKEVQFQQIYFESKTDLSGMLVKSNNPVSLVCGDLYENAIRTLEHILPVSALGIKFYAYPRMIDIQSSLKFVAPYNCSLIRIGKRKFKMDAGDVKEFPWEEVGYSKIVSDVPLLVTQLFWKGNSLRRQESMALVPSFKQYLRRYCFPRNFKYRYRLYIGVLAFVDFTIKQENKFKSLFETRSNGFFMHKDRKGVTVEVESPFSTPFLAYSFRRDIKASRKNGGDIMTSPVGFNFSEQMKVTESVRKRNTCVTDRATTSSTEMSIEEKTTGTTTYLQEAPTASAKSQSSTYEAARVSQVQTTTERDECKCPNLTTEAHVTNIPDSTTMTNKELERKLESIKRELALDKSTLSSTRRRKISANDTRISAKGIGFVGVIILCLVFGIITLMDMPLFLKHALILWGNMVGRPIETCRRRVVRMQS